MPPSRRTLDKGYDVGPVNLDKRERDRLARREVARQKIRRILAERYGAEAVPPDPAPAPE